MNTLTKLDPTTVAKGLKSGSLVLIDIRNPDERAREYIAGSKSLPVSTLDAGGMMLEAGKQAVFHCKTGMRTDTNCDALATHVEGEAFVLEGGLDAWKKAGLPTTQNTSAPMEINRQVQITAGTLVLAGILLGATVHPAFFALSAFIGAGLAFAGVSGWCGMAQVLAAMPWNRKPTTA